MTRNQQPRRAVTCVDRLLRRLHQLRYLAVVLPGCALGVAAYAAQPELDIRVIPRIGLFDPLLFVGGTSRQTTPARIAQRLDNAGISTYVDKGNWKPLDYDDYLGATHERLRKLLPQPIEVAGKKWNGFELLTGFAPNIGYARRTAIISLKNRPDGRVTGCQLTSDKGSTWPAKEFYDNNCTIAVELDNSATRLTLSYTSLEPTTSAVSVTGTVPEDFLLVSVGDSYASGEGNPDGLWGNSPATADPDNSQQQSCARELGSGVRELLAMGFGKLDEKKCAPLWMDQRCHRSAWAGPIQAGLALLKADKQRSGAYTILSLACSGATIDAGLRGDYTNPPRSYMDLQKQFPGRGILAYSPDTQATATGVAPVAAQISTTLATTLMHDHGGKRHIDLMTISIGGNDIRFADIVTDIFSEKVPSMQQEMIESWKKNELDNLKKIKFGQLAQEIQGFDIRQLVITEYPDPTRDTQLANPMAACNGGPDAEKQLSSFCEGSVMAGWVSEKVANAADKRLSKHESRFSHCALAVPLGKALDEAAGKNGWFFASGIADGFVGKGWCADKDTATPSLGNWFAELFTPHAKKTTIDAFAERERWFRRADESIAFQGSVHGTMHPTWQGHGVYSEKIVEAARQSLARELSITVENTLAAHGTITYLKPPLTVRLEEGGAGQQRDRTQMDRVCLAHGPAANQPAKCMECLVRNAGDPDYCARDGHFQLRKMPPDPPVLRALHSETKRTVVKPLRELLVAGTTVLQFDDSPPRIDRRDFLSRSGRPCTPDWISADCDLRITVVDDGVGVKAVRAELRSCPQAESSWAQCALMENGLVSVESKPGTSTLALVISSLARASAPVVKLEVSMTDWLGNTHTDPSDKVGLDVQAPTLVALEVHGQTIPGSELNDAQALPFYPGYAPTLFAHVLDSVSRPAKLSFKTTDSQHESNIDLQQTSETMRIELRLPIYQDSAGPAGTVGVEMRVTDVAGNEAVVGKLQVLPIPLQLSGKGRSTNDWAAAANAPESRKILERVRLMSSHFNDWLPSDNARWPLLSAWLNLAAGLVRTTQPVLSRVNGDCSAATAETSVTVWQTLRLADACLRKFPDRAAELAKTFAEGLQAQETWCRRESGLCQPK